MLKFRGAGQGTKALIAELVAGEIGRALGLPVPEIVFVELDPVLGHSEPDFEIQALIKASGGLNLGLDFLPGALAFDPLDIRHLDSLLASTRNPLGWVKLPSRITVLRLRPRMVRSGVCTLTVS